MSMSVKEVQIALNRHGYGPVSTDGLMGPITMQALKKFQVEHNMMADGIVGPKTTRALEQGAGSSDEHSVLSYMAMSDRGRKDLLNSEGVEREAYFDNATPPVLTIGVGFTMRSDAFRDWWAENRPGEKFSKESKMTDAEIDDALTKLLEEEYGAKLNEYLGKEVPQHVFDAMLNAVYNLGYGSLQWTWAQYAKAGEYKQAATRLKTTGVTAGGKKLAGLVSRRAREAKMLEFGIYANS